MVWNYRNNVAAPAQTNSFNLASHTAYLESVIKTGTITSHVVFSKEEGREVLKQNGVTDDGWKTNLPCTTSGRFPDRENIPIERVMMGVRRPNGVLVNDDDKDGFGCTCLLGLWGLHSKRALTRCTHNSADGQYKVQGVNICPLCCFWNTNDVSMNNHVRKHYNMGLCCLED